MRRVLFKFTVITHYQSGRPPVPLLLKAFLIKLIRILVGNSSLAKATKRCVFPLNKKHFLTIFRSGDFISQKLIFNHKFLNNSKNRILY